MIKLIILRRTLTNDNKMTKDEVEQAIAHRTEESYKSKIKREVDLHLNGMDNQISHVSTKTDHVKM